MRPADIALYRMGLLWLLIVVLLVMGGGPARSVEPPSLRDLDAQLEPFKAEFLKDSKKTRVVALLSPT